MVEHTIWSILVAVLGVALFGILFLLIGPWAIIPSIIFIVIVGFFVKW